MSEPVATTPVTLFMGELNPPTGTPTKLPALPTPSSDPEAMRVFLEKVKEILEVYEGIRGSKFDQVVTWRDMFQNGMVDLTVSGVRYSANPITPTISLPTVSEYTAPPNPTGFTLSAGITTIILSWDVATYGNHAYTEVWRSDNSNLANATLIGTTNSFAYADSVGTTSTTKYYWIRFISEMNVVGGYNSATGTSGSTTLVGTDSIENLAITNAKIGNLAVDAAKIADATIVTAKIADATITTGKIQDASITTAKIVTAAITNALIANAAISSAKIGDGEITNAKINDVIQSSDFSSGSAGWRIQKSGNAELNNATFRGTLSVKSATSGARTEMTNEVIKVFDSSGTLRVKIGNLSA